MQTPRDLVSHKNDVQRLEQSPKIDKLIYRDLPMPTGVCHKTNVALAFRPAIQCNTRLEARPKVLSHGLAYRPLANHPAFLVAQRRKVWAHANAHHTTYTANPTKPTRLDDDNDAAPRCRRRTYPKLRASHLGCPHCECVTSHSLTRLLPEKALALPFLVVDDGIMLGEWLRLATPIRRSLDEATYPAREGRGAMTE